MSLFDNKQEVLSIELTPHGKNLLREGKFKPTYYTFHDDDIIYDPKYVDSSILEAPKDIFGRITIDAAYLKPQIRYVETLKNINITDTDRLNFNIGYYPAGLPIGTSDINSPYLPSWNLKFTNGKIDTTTSNQYRKFIDNCLNIKVPLISLQPLSISYSEGSERNLSYNSSSLNINGKVYTVYREEILLELEEINAANTMENFEIEIFIDNKKLSFTKPIQNVINNILLDEPIQIDTPVGVQTVSDFFDILIDDQIDFETATRGGIINVADKTNPAPFKDEC